VALRPHAGLVVGAGPRRTRYGFRRYPDAVDGWARLLASPVHGRLGVEARHQRRWTGRDARGWAFARASDLEAVAFRGFGNDAPARRPAPGPVVWERQLLLDAGVEVATGGGLTWSAAALLRRTDPDRPADAAAPTALGLEETWHAAGLRGSVELARRDALPVTRRGWTVSATGTAFPLSDAGPGAFGRAGALATAYLRPWPGPIVALRAGAEGVWGAYPVQYAAFIGSGETVRGLGRQRYAGDRSAFGAVELRQPLGGSFGALALADAGRIWYRRASPGGWHTALGAGAWFGMGPRAASVVLAFGERPVVHAGVGLPF
jgi:hypothetical protein